MNALIVILGPTASGKTALGIDLAKKYNGVVISADSRQIYRELDIGTAKPYVDFSNPKTVHSFLNTLVRPKTWRESIVIDDVPHHMVDIVNPDEEYSVAQYQDQVMQLIQEIHAHEQLPILVGGTGLYIQAIVDQLRIPRVPADWDVRRALEKRIDEHGLDAVYKELITVDPKAERVVQSKNPRRVIRALEVMLKTGIPFTEHRKVGKPPFSVLQIGRTMPRDALDQRINDRVDVMMEVGFLDEVRVVGEKYHWEFPSLSGQGYQEMRAHIRGEISLDEAMERTKRATRQYARRQMTWFKKDQRIQWVDSHQQANDIVSHFFQEYKSTPT